MSQLTLWDHAFASLVFVVYPVYSMLTVRGAIQNIRKRGEGARLAAYREVILTWMFFAACLTAIWVFLDRDWADLEQQQALLSGPMNGWLYSASLH